MHLVNDLYLAMRNFCKLAVNDSSIKIIESNQNKMRPATQFLSVAINSADVAYEYDREIEDDKLVYHLRAVSDVTITALMADIHISCDTLHKVRKAFYTDLTYDAFKDAFALSEILKEVSVIPTVFADKIEEVAILEVRMNCYDSVTYSPSFIEHVELTAEIENLTFNVRT